MSETVIKPLAQVDSVVVEEGTQPTAIDKTIEAGKTAAAVEGETAAKPKPTGWRSVLPVHPIADLFPLMSADELKALARDIKANNLRERVAIQMGADGKPVLLDGRNRLDAFALLHKNLHWRASLGSMSKEIPGNVDPVAYIISANIRRRHLTADDKRKVIAALIKAQPEKSSLQIAKMLGVSPTTVTKVRAELVDKGDVSKMETSTDTKGRKQPVKKKRRTEDDVTRDLRAKKAAAIATAMPGDVGPMLPDAPPPPAEDAPTVAGNPIVIAFDAASDAERRQFVRLRRAEIISFAMTKTRGVEENRAKE